MNKVSLQNTDTDENASMNVPSFALKSNCLRIKKSISAAFVLMILLTFTGCTPVKFYSNQNLTQTSGLKYYISKPYIQVERDPATNNIIKTTVLYLPDLANPQYMVIKDGIGSKKVDVKLTDGSINTFGVATYPKIPETIEAVAAMLAKSTNALSDLAALKGMPQAAALPTITELYEVFMGPEGTTLKKVEFK
jgi:hypothetical protein